MVREFKAAGKTVLLVSHVLPEVEELCDTLAVLVAGQVVHTRPFWPDLLRDPGIGRQTPARNGPETALRERGGRVNSLPMAIRTVRWMVRDTFRQSLASKLFWVMLGLTAFCSVFCLGVSVSGDEEPPRHPFQLPLYLPRTADSA